MNSNALSYPLKYFQQTTFRTRVSNTTKASISLTGVRSGSLKSIDLWVNKESELAGNPNKWVLPGGVRLLVNGLVYYDTTTPGGNSASHQFWSICDRKTAAMASMAFPDGVDASGNPIMNPGAMYWVNIPFAQHTEALAGDSVIATGIPVMNSILNLEIELPTTDAYVVSASYNYCSNLLFSRGGADYVF